MTGVSVAVGAAFILFLAYRWKQSVAHLWVHYLERAQASYGGQLERSELTLTQMRVGDQGATLIVLQKRGKADLTYMEQTLVVQDSRLEPIALSVSPVSLAHKAPASRGALSASLHHGEGRCIYGDCEATLAVRGAQLVGSWQNIWRVLMGAQLSLPLGSKNQSLQALAISQGSLTLRRVANPGMLTNLASIKTLQDMLTQDVLTAQRLLQVIGQDEDALWGMILEHLDEGSFPDDFLERAYKVCLEHAPGAARERALMTLTHEVHPHVARGALLELSDWTELARASDERLLAFCAQLVTERKLSTHAQDPFLTEALLRFSPDMLADLLARDEVSALGALALLAGWQDHDSMLKATSALEAACEQLSVSMRAHILWHISTHPDLLYAPLLDGVDLQGERQALCTPYINALSAWNEAHDMAHPVADGVMRRGVKRLVRRWLLTHDAPERAMIEHALLELCTAADLPMVREHVLQEPELSSLLQRLMSHRGLSMSAGELSLAGSSEEASGALTLTQHGDLSAADPPE